MSTPQPSAASPELAEIIRETIRHYGGAMPFDVFMAMALYHQRLGYYAAGRQVTGREGDFYTSVSVGDLFGRLLALQARQVWERLGKPKRFWLVEQGANDGRLAGDILSTLISADDALSEAVRYVFIEPFEPNQALQQQTLEAEGIDHRALWVSEIGSAAEYTARGEGMFLSNELVDSFPVHLITFHDGRWHERLVREAGEGFDWEDRPVPEDTSLAEAIAEREIPHVEGYTTEVNLGAESWMRQATRTLERGLWLTIDYGYVRPAYYSPERRDGTLRTFHHHRRDTDPLADPGETDITADVDFTGLARAGEYGGLTTLGFVDQHHFIMGLCAEAFARNEFPGSDRAPTPEEIRAFRTLSHPEIMGTRFHVLAQTRGLWTWPKLDGMRFARSAQGLL